MGEGVEGYNKGMRKEEKQENIIEKKRVRESGGYNKRCSGGRRREGAGRRGVCSGKP